MVINVLNVQMINSTTQDSVVLAHKAHLIQVQHVSLSTLTNVQ